MARSKRQQRRGIRIVRKADRGRQIIEDPKEYFDAARREARKQVERDMQRERQLVDA